MPTLAATTWSFIGELGMIATQNETSDAGSLSASVFPSSTAEAMPFMITCSDHWTIPEQSYGRGHFFAAQDPHDESDLDCPQDHHVRELLEMVAPSENGNKKNKNVQRRTTEETSGSDESVLGCEEEGRYVEVSASQRYPSS
jgi:hypothetical protein